MADVGGACFHWPGPEPTSPLKAVTAQGARLSTLICACWVRLLQYLVGPIVFSKTLPSENPQATGYSRFASDNMSSLAAQACAAASAGSTIREEPVLNARFYYSLLPVLCAIGPSSKRLILAAILDESSYIAP